MHARSPVFWHCDIISLFQTSMHLPVCTIKEYWCHHVYYWYVVFGHSFISRITFSIYFFLFIIMLLLSFCWWIKITKTLEINYRFEIPSKVYKKVRTIDLNTDKLFSWTSAAGTFGGPMTRCTIWERGDFGGWAPSVKSVTLHLLHYDSPGGSANQRFRLARNYFRVYWYLRFFFCWTFSSFYGT